MNATCRDVEPRLSEYVDGTLDDATATEIRAHLRTCAACRAEAGDLRQIRRAARDLAPIEPPAHIWMEIAGRIRLGDKVAPPVTMVRAAGGRAIWTWLGLAAALVIVTLGLAVLQRSAFPPPASNVATTGSVETLTDELNMATDHYERAIAELQAAAASATPAVDASTASVVTRDLGAVDKAIAESRAALVANPESEPARDSLFEALRRKVLLLQATVELVNEMRLGDQNGAARAAESLGKKS